MGRDRLRLDQALCERGLAPSRARAQGLILAGVVRVDGEVATKAGRPVERQATITVDAPDHPWVSRAGIKLAAALEAFHLDPSGCCCLDVGASTGGFTHVLLERGATSVVALDVGRGQLDWRLRQDPRVEVRDGVNARFLTSDDLPGPFDLIVVDVSFISLRLVLPALRTLLTPGGDLVALVKPQFEAGRSQVGKGGVVRDPSVREAAILGVIAAADELGLRLRGRLASPLPGPAGNVEELVWLTPSA
ncbi:MAG: TlyA family RNA methyltransferase [Thermoanaerobaculaceae bacterium]|nr:TlyA family RNA methyltransferase [Thermoanaerobaculaceae bacterium]MDI9622391.1 TlyA family RNA methyltransferase [Acidobacteriota bacterium]NLH11146.1 TlyA family RNA methyltransferase [Holophagae bacterium]HPW54292.1 TlyA family RNA methyltransferase [Thermoanaerobaculaceae bacterium]